MRMFVRPPFYPPFPTSLSPHRFCTVFCVSNLFKAFKEYPTRAQLLDIHGGENPPLFSENVHFLEVTVALQLNNFWVLLPVNRGQKPRNLIVILILQTLDVPNISLETK